MYEGKGMASERGKKGLIKIGVSACLIGKRVRYDGGHKYNASLIRELGESFMLVPCCPEVEYGLSVPREPMRLEARYFSPTIPTIVTVTTRVEHTDGMKRWSGERLSLLEKEGIRGFIFKARSPSCGLKGVDVYTGEDVFMKGQGIFAAAFTKRFPDLPAIEEEDLNHPQAVRDFIREVLKASF